MLRRAERLLRGGLSFIMSPYYYFVVMAGLDPATHGRFGGVYWSAVNFQNCKRCGQASTPHFWVAGSSPAMTIVKV
jgi:hypothetical protein